MSKSSMPLRSLTKAAVATGGAVAALAGVNAWIRTTAGPLPDQLPGARQLFTWREHQIVYYTAGPADGEPVVLVHGHNAAASAWEMREPFHRLGQHHRVIAPDLLGYGCSDHPPLTYTAELYIDLLRDFLREAVRQPAAVIASSVSAAHAIQIAADDPEWITRLVVIQPTGLSRQTGPAPGGQAITALFRSPVLGEALFNGLASRPSIRYFLQSQSYVNSDCVDEDLVEINYQTAHQPGARYAPASFVGGLLYHDVTDAWPRVGQPVIVAWGQEAHFTPLRDSAPFLALNPGAQLEVFSPSGILPHDEQPEAFATIVGAWLAQIAKLGATKSVIKEVVFGQEAIDYIRDSLKVGQSLMARLCDLPLESGRVWSYLPEGISQEMIKRVEWGGILSGEAGHLAELSLANFIADYIAQPGNRYGVFQDFNSKPTNPWLLSEEGRFFTAGPEVYQFLNSEDAEVQTIIATHHRGDTANARLNIGILTVLEGEAEIRSGQEVGVDILQMLADNTEHIIVGAFDAEGELVWSRLWPESP